MKQFFQKLSDKDIRNVIAVIYIILCLAYIYVLAFVPVPPANKDLVNVLGGSVIGGLGLILAYFFGSSKKDTPQ